MSDLGDFTDFDGEATGEVDDDPQTTHDGDFEPVSVSPSGEERGIGVLSAAQGLTISEDGEETRLRAYVTVGNRAGVRIGTYLLAPYPDSARKEQLFCRITALEYAREFRADDATEIHARRAMRSRGIDEQDFKFIAELEPVAILYSEARSASERRAAESRDIDRGELQRRMTDRVPKPETIVS
ncbi:MAG: AAA family ATPase, partial [archaeon]